MYIPEPKVKELGKGERVAGLYCCINMFTQHTCCLLLFSLAALVVGSLKCIENWPGKTYCVTEWMLCFAKHYWRAGRGAWSQGAKDIAGLRICWEGAESSSPNTSCIVAEMLASLPGQPCTLTFTGKPLLRLFTDIHACLNLCECPAFGFENEDVVWITKTAFAVRAIYIYSFSYPCALVCPGEFCSSLPVFKHKYPQWDLQIHTSLENWGVTLKAAMQHPNYTSRKA